MKALQIFTGVLFTWYCCSAAFAGQEAEAKIDNVFFFCKPDLYVHKQILSESEKIICAGVDLQSDEMEKACGPFRMDLSELEEQGGFYVSNIPMDNEKEQASQAFSLSRSTGRFTFFTEGPLSSTEWTGTCWKKTEKFKY